MNVTPNGTFQKGAIMPLHDFIRGLKRLAVVVAILILSWAICILAIIGFDHIIYDHMLFGLLK